MALSNSGWMQSRNTNVALCRMGKVGMNRTKNMCKHSSKKTEWMELDSAAVVTLDDCDSVRMPLVCKI